MLWDEEYISTKVWERVRERSRYDRAAMAYLTIRHGR